MEYSGAVQTYYSALKFCITQCFYINTPLLLSQMFSCFPVLSHGLSCYMSCYMSCYTQKEQKAEDLLQMLSMRNTSVCSLVCSCINIVLKRGVLTESVNHWTGQTSPTAAPSTYTFRPEISKSIHILLYL